MNHFDTSACDEIIPGPPSGFLLTPFGWAAESLAMMVSAEPSLLVDLFTISRPRMHLIALALAHLPVSPEIAPLLLRGSARQVTERLFGQAPAGLKRVLSRLPVEVLQRENYRRLVGLLADPGAAKVLHHAGHVDDTAIRILADLPQPLRQLAIAVPSWQCTLDGLTASLEFLVSRGFAPSADALVAELATVTSSGQLAAVIEVWVRGLPLPEAMPPARFVKARRLDDVAKVCSLAKAWRNCLVDFASGIDAGTLAVISGASLKTLRCAWCGGMADWGGFWTRSKALATPTSRQPSLRRLPLRSPMSAS
jgi:hypothetical protein